MRRDDSNHQPRRGAERSAEIAQLRAFCTAADLGTLGRAAVALGITQPALSKRLRALEAIAGTRLLERSPNGVTLTAAGRRLYPEARKLLEQAAVIEDVLGDLDQELPPIRLAVSHTLAEFYLPPELVAYQATGERRPPVELTIANTAAIREMIRDGRAELGMTAADPGSRSDDGLEERELLDDELVVAVPQDHAWYQRDVTPLRLLLSTPLVVRDPAAHDRRCVEAALSARGLSMAPPLVEVGSTTVAKREAIERSAPVLLSALALDERRDRLYARPVEGLRFPRRFVVVARSFELLSRGARDFVAFLLRKRGAERPAVATR